MTSLLTIKREVEKLRQILIPKPSERIVVRMYMPPDDPRYGMTDAEIERFDPKNKFVVKPPIIIKPYTEEMHKQFEESEKP